jgi:hypothetical protein
MPDIYNPGYVEKLFDEMSESYERVNYITSFGFSNFLGKSQSAFSRGKRARDFLWF